MVRGIVSRRLALVSLAFGLFVLFDLALFGWLIFRSLSQREIEKLLLETREEAEDVAAEIAASAARRGDLYTAIAGEQKTLTFIDSILRQRALVKTLEIRSPDGVLVYRGQSQGTVTEDRERPLLTGLEVGGVVSEDKEERRQEFLVPNIEVPIGRLGTLQIGINPEEMGRRIALLRADLIHETSLIGALTLALLVSAYLAIFFLLRRARRLEEQAAESERMAYIGTLASGLAHEIRNPLNSLSLNVQMLQEELEEAGVRLSSERLMGLTRSEMARLERLVSDFLSYARPRAPELEQVAARELLERARGVLAGALRRAGAEIEVDDATGGAELRVDAGQMGQLLLNLLQNALDACEGTGRPARLRLAARRTPGGVALEVGDNGAGIPPEILGKVFDLFYSTRKGGTGLGLAIVQRIAQNHGGRVLIDSRPGAGTEVTVLLPGALGADVPGRELAAPERTVAP